MRKSCSLWLVAALLLAGCVNLHVHFPSAPEQAAQQQDEKKKP